MLLAATSVFLVRLDLLLLTLIDRLCVLNILSLFLGRRRTLTTSLTKRRLSSEAEADVKETEAEIQDLEVQINDLTAEAQSLIKDIDSRWDEVVQSVGQIPLQASRSDVYVSLFGIAWLPFHLVDVGGREVDIPAFEE